MTTSSPLQSKKRPRKPEEEATTISSSPLQSKDRRREYKETNKSTSGKDFEASSSISVKKANVSTVSRSTSKVNEKYVSQSANLVGSGKRGKHSLTSELIKNGVLVSGTNVSCKGRNDVIKRGRIFCEGIVCDCCQQNLSATKFEAHAGCTQHRPAQTIMLEDGRSLSECRSKAVSSPDQNGNQCIVEASSEAGDGCVVKVNNDACSVCGFGGEIVLCDKCPASFHKKCLVSEQVLGGDWFCPTCRCKVCNKPKCEEEFADDDNDLLACVQCEKKFHFGCVKAKGFGSIPIESIDKKKNWFCSKVCGKMFVDLKKLLGEPITVAAKANTTWTLFKNGGGNTFNKKLFKLKLNMALAVLYESFGKTIDVLSRRDFTKDVIFSRYSKDKRLNFHGFYIVILEKNGEVISVATVRIYGKKVAEIVFVATKQQYRRKGMCRLLMGELEKQLIRLGVESLVLHSSKEALNTWTKNFGFAEMTLTHKLEFIDYNFFEFQETVMCLKRLIQPCNA